MKTTTYSSASSPKHLAEDLLERRMFGYRLVRENSSTQLVGIPRPVYSVGQVRDCLLKSILTGSGPYQESLSMCSGDFSTEIKRPVCKTDQ